MVNTGSRKRYRQTKSFTSTINLTTVNTSEFKITRLVQLIMWLEMPTTGMFAFLISKTRYYHPCYETSCFRLCVSCRVHLNSEPTALSQFAGRQN